MSQSKFGFSHTMTGAEIRKTYMKMALKYHPDKINQRANEVTVEDNQIFQDLQNEYELFMEHFNQFGASPKPAEKSTPPHPSSFSRAPSPPKQAPPSPPRSSKATNPPKCRCCSVCKKPGHTKTTCPLVDPKKAAKRERAEQRKEKKQKKSSPPPQKEEPKSRTFESPEVHMEYSIRFTVPKGVKAGDVVNVPYTTPSGPKIYKFNILERHLRYTQLFVKVPL